MTQYMRDLSDDELEKHETALKAQVPQSPAVAPRDVMSSLEAISAEWHNRIFFRGLSDAQIRLLQADNPPVNSDASAPANDYSYAIIAEGKRRKLW